MEIGRDDSDSGDDARSRARHRSRPPAHYTSIHEPRNDSRPPEGIRIERVQSRSRRPDNNDGVPYVVFEKYDGDDKRASGHSGYERKSPGSRYRVDDNMRPSRRQRRSYVVEPTERRPSQRPTSVEANQDEDDVLDDYYGGQDAAPEDPIEEIIYGRPSFMDENRYSRPPPRPSYPEDLPVPGAQEPPTRPYADATYYRPEVHVSSRVEQIRTTSRRDDFLRHAPRGAQNKALWPRAVVPTKIRAEDRRGAYDDGESLSLTLKLVLTRRGMRFKGREFAYTKKTWDDRAFAVQLQREYRSLKTREIGWLQKITSYKRIAFVYFLQYHAYPAPHYPYGRWRISNRQPVTRRDDQVARNAFMFRLEKHLRSGGLFGSSGGKRDAQRPTRDWVGRLDCLIEPGAVIDIEIKETFDTVKIYIGLIIAILLSLAAGLAYGFATPNQDFATGFSLASWVITSFGFFLAAIAAGEWIGLEKPGADMLAAEELSTGTRLDREILELR